MPLATAAQLVDVCPRFIGRPDVFRGAERALERRPVRARNGAKRGRFGLAHVAFDRDARFDVDDDVFAPVRARFVTQMRGKANRAASTRRDEREARRIEVDELPDVCARAVRTCCRRSA